MRAPASTQSSLVVLGAAGFLGRALIALEARPHIKAVARNLPKATAAERSVRWFASDLLSRGALDGVIEAGDVVVNLAFIREGARDANLELIDNVIESSLRRGAKRLLHCSTAVVAGAARSRRVTETTPCLPTTEYERTKLAVEQRVLETAGPELDIGILRPTAIVGPGGQNLVKLARALQRGHPVLNYLRACFFGKRPMHLVPLRNVAAALLHLAAMRTALERNVYIVSADHDPDNNYLTVERLLAESLGVAMRRTPTLQVPGWTTSTVLRALRRPESDVQRVYDCSKLLATDFVPLDSVRHAVREVGESLRSSL